MYTQQTKTLHLELQICMTLWEKLGINIGEELESNDNFTIKKTKR